jgi:hypothetical protein
MFSESELADGKLRESLIDRLIYSLDTGSLRNSFNFRRFLNDNSLFLILMEISSINRFAENCQKYPKRNRKRQNVILIICRNDIDSIARDYESAIRDRTFWDGIFVNRIRYL